MVPINADAPHIYVGVSKDNSIAGLRLTAAYYFTPKGREIQNVGIQPDVDLKNEIESKEVQQIDDRSVADKSRLASTKVEAKKDVVVRTALDWLKSGVTVVDYKLKQ